LGNWIIVLAASLLGILDYFIDKNLILEFLSSFKLVPRVEKKYKYVKNCFIFKEVSKKN